MLPEFTFLLFPASPDPPVAAATLQASHLFLPSYTSDTTANIAMPKRKERLPKEIPRKQTPM